MSPTLAETGDDLSALAWVHEELRRSLDAAHKALRRFVKETESLASSDIEAVDPAVLRGARTQIHQGVGALELVGLPAAAMVLRASEAAVQRYVSKPHKLTTLVVDDIERASFALLDYLTRMLANKPVSALALFPQYRAVQEAAGADRVHPADLWAVDWQWRDLPADREAAPRQPDAATHAALEALLLAMMRAANPLAVAERMSDVCAGLGTGASKPQTGNLWKLASAVFEAQAQSLLGFDVFSKRVASRLLAQYRILERGESELSERLALDLLFFCAQSAAPGAGDHAPRLAAVRQVYGLAQHTPVDYTVSPLGRFDPALVAQARKRVTAAKEAWSAIAGGEMHRLGGLSEQFALVGDSLKRLFPLGETFAAELQQAVAQTQLNGAAPPAPLAMEVATSLLYVEAALEDAEFDNPEQAMRVKRLAERLAAVRQGRAPDPLETWMEELYRRVSDRQTMGSVVQELRASLSEAEKLIDQYFRNPVARDVLIPVPNQLSAMRGVLSVLGMDHASQALLRMRDEVDGLVSTEIDPARVHQAGVFDRLAGNLGALGFLIDMLSVQPQMAKSLFRFDAESGTLSPVMGRGAVHAPSVASATAVDPRLIEQAQLLAASSVNEDVSVEDVSRDLERLSHEAQAADQPALAATVLKAQEALEAAHDRQGLAMARGDLSEALSDFVTTASDPVGLEPERSSGRVTTPMKLSFAEPDASAELADDGEMREIFLEEAQEVLTTARAAHAELARAPDDLAALATLRRAFHTLKGSSRMVGLKEFGDAAWAGEQLYNSHLADQGAAEPALLAFTAWSLAHLSDWVTAISAKNDAGHDAAAMKAAAHALSEGQAPAGTNDVSDIALPLLPPDLPSAADLDLSALALPDAPLPEVSFEFDLSGLGNTEFDPFVHAATEPMQLAMPAPQPGAEPALDMIDLDLGFDDLVEAAPMPEAAPDSVHAALEELPLLGLPEAEPQVKPESEDELVKQVGHLRIGIPLFNIYLIEADELSRRLTTEIAEWAMELHRPIGEASIALAHSLAGSSATVGFSDLSSLARALEHAQTRSLAIGYGTPEEARLFVDAAEEVRRLLHQFAAGFLKEPAPELLARLAEHERSSAKRLEAATAASELEQARPEPEDKAALSPMVTPTQPPTLAEAPAPDLVMDTSHAALSAPVPFTVSAFGDSQFGALGLTELKPFGELPIDALRSGGMGHALVDADDTIDAVDAIDAELFPIFEEEAEELLPQLAAKLRDWVRRPSEAAHPAACMRTLHTLKGGARLAGAMRLGEMAHRLETRIEHVLALQPVSAPDVETLQIYGDALSQTFDALRSQDAPAVVSAPRSAEPARARPDTSAPAAPLQVLLTEAPREQADQPAPVAPTQDDVVTQPAPLQEATEPDAAVRSAEPGVLASLETRQQAVQPAAAPIDWARFSRAEPAVRKAPERTQGTQSAVRVRAPLLDRLVNLAGEVSITRSRIDSGVSQMKGSLGDLTENLERLRAQLRDIEFHGEMQMTSRLEAAKAASQSFDPLEFDRFTRFQELTRMMAESVNDVHTVQRTLQRSVENTEDELVAQARMTRDLQDDLLRTRMVEFEGLSDRLYRVVRQAAKETGKVVRLDIVGGSIEVDRGVLDRMTGSFEHLLRNCVGHGIEMPAVRSAAGKDPTGSIIVALTQEGNEVGVEFRDDGAGLNLQRIRAKGLALGLIDANASTTDADLANLIFTPGFSTAESVTELAGRGVGMDVVRSEVNAMGGRVETATAAGKGTSFRMVLPLTTAVTQVVMLRCGETQVAVPSTLVEVVRRATLPEIEQAYTSGVYAMPERTVQFFWLGALLQLSPRSLGPAERTRTIVVIRSAQQRIALHVDEVLGNQEVVVKNLGPQLSRMPGLAGITLLASGAVALIYNPVALATLYGDTARAATNVAMRAPALMPAQMSQAEAAEKQAPLVMVVDDSLTVRRVTQRLLVREGYRVVLAKDGLDALERLAEELPQVVLSDIEMPRMDGFDLVRNMRGDARMRGLPVIMITSRIAQKHRDYAAELGVDHYLGKPYSEEDLLALVASYTSATVAA
jgi:chemosensory pili system protein ChpA (sensor histidine kinase/response regulator)